MRLLNWHRFAKTNRAKFHKWAPCTESSWHNSRKVTKSWTCVDTIWRNYFPLCFWGAHMQCAFASHHPNYLLSDSAAWAWTKKPSGLSHAMEFSHHHRILGGNFAVQIQEIEQIPKKIWKNIRKVPASLKSCHHPPELTIFVGWFYYRWWILVLFPSSQKKI